MEGGGRLPIAPGTRLGPYRVEAFLARGATGEVYRAVDERLGRPVALKTLPAWLVEDEAVRARFLAEARLAASLDHPHVLPVYEVGETDGAPWIAMRLAAGPDLREIIRREAPLAPPRVVALLDGIAAALDAAHAVRLLHRDVKPGNIVVAADGRGEHAYLADFGLATLAQDRAVTRTGELLGTIDYVSPEQARGDPLDARSDVYALAAVAYEALTGHAPFEHLAALVSLRVRLEEAPPAPSTRRPDLPERVDRVLLRGLDPDPRNRPASAGTLLAELRAAVDGPRLRGLLFADLRDYTGFAAREGDDRAAALLARYRSLIRAAVQRAGGVEIRTEGDSFYVVFPSASAALRAGVAIAEAAAAATAEDPSLPIRVGVGVNAGEPVAAPEGPIGGAVNSAARICSLAAPGEVLASATARALAEGSHDIVFEPRGARPVKGLDAPVETWAARRSPAVPSRASPAEGALSGTERRPASRRTGIMVAAGVVAAALLGIAALATLGGAVRPGGAPSTSAPAVGAAPNPSAGPTATSVPEPAAGPTAAAPPGAGPPNGGTPTPGAFPNEAERALLATLPAEIARTCIRGATQDDARRAGFVGEVATAWGTGPSTPIGYTDVLPPAPIAGVTCRPVAGAGASRLFVQQQPHSIQLSVADEYLGYLARRWEANDGDCATDAAARQRWSSTRATGALACFSSHPYDGRPWIYFTYGGGKYLGFATRDDADYDALFAWWERLRPFLP